MSGLNDLIKGKIFDFPVLRFFFHELKYLDSKNDKNILGPKFSEFDPWIGHHGDPLPLNISGTDENFDTRSSRGSQDQSPPHSDQFQSKSCK